MSCERYHAIFLKISTTTAINTKTDDTAKAKLASAVWNALKDNGDGAGYCVYVLGDDGNVTFAQWSDVENPTGGVLGQYPNPCSKPDNANKPFADTAYTKDSWAPAAGD